MFQKLINFFTGKNEEDSRALLKDSFLLDVRSETEFANAHVKGSVNIPLNQLNQHIDSLRNKQPITVFCQSGMRAGMAKSLLKKNGIATVTNAGGWQKVQRTLNQNNSPL